MNAIKIIKPITYLSLLSLVLPSGNSSFYINNPISDSLTNVTTSEGKTAVAYVDNPSLLFTTIEAALEYAGNSSNISISNNIYVIPNTNPTITRDCIVASNDHLIIPYDHLDLFFLEDGLTPSITLENIDPLSANQTCRNGTEQTFADTDDASITKYRKNSILIDNATLTIDTQAELNISGIVGNDAIGLSAATSGNYTEIVLGDNSKIINNGTIKCCGYIKKNSINSTSNVILNSGSTVYMPFVVYDYEGGTNTVVAYCTSNISPFNGYNMPNIQTDLLCNYGSHIYGLVDLWTGGGMGTDPQHNLSNVLIIGTDTDKESLFKLESEDSNLKINYKSNNHLYTANNWNNGNMPLTTLSFYGNASINSLTISVKAITDSPVKITTKNLYFPFSYLYKIEISDGTLNLNSMFKFLPGSSLEVSENSLLYVNESAIFYSEFNDLYGLNDTKYPNNLSEAYLMNQGSVTVNPTIKSNTYFGGKILTKKGMVDKEISFFNTTTIEVSSIEAGGGSLIISDLNEETIRGFLKELGRDGFWSLLSYISGGEFDDGTKNAVGKLGEYTGSNAGTQTITESATGYIGNSNALKTFNNNFSYNSSKNNNYWDEGKSITLKIAASGLDDGGIFGYGKKSINFSIYYIDKKAREILLNTCDFSEDDNRTHTFTLPASVKSIFLHKNNSNGDPSISGFSRDQPISINESVTNINLSISF